MNNKLKDNETDKLFKAILSLESIDECYDFFEDLCTVAEIKAMAQRLFVAEMLNKNCIYTEIEQKTGASSATISRVKKSLNYGANGYKKALERLDKTNE